MTRMSLWLALVLILITISAVSSFACVDGCSSIPLHLNEYVVIQQGSGESPCSPACGTDGVVYMFILVTSCGGTTGTMGNFCSSDFVTPGNYYVQSIGAGCSGTPQGCVRLCSCP